MKPQIRRLGTIDCDLVETTPVVFKNKLYRFEYVRQKYAANQSGDSYFRLVDQETGTAGQPFAAGYHLGNIMVDGDTIFVTGTNIWDGERVDIFSSSDMENWDSWNALDLPGYGIFNTSLCRDNTQYVLMFEIGRPQELAGRGFTAQFATSPDMKQWSLLPPECNYSKDRYTAPHCLRYHQGYYYNFYLEAVNDDYEQYVVRSADLINWESSPYNPVMKASDEDRQIVNPSLTAEERERIATSQNRNNSDIDFCEYQDMLIINYSWGDQLGIEFLAEARFDGSLADFLTGWFPGCTKG